MRLGALATGLAILKIGPVRAVFAHGGAVGRCLIPTARMIDFLDRKKIAQSFQ